MTITHISEREQALQRENERLLQALKISSFTVETQAEQLAAPVAQPVQEPVAWRCTKRIKPAIDPKEFGEPFIASNPEYVKAHPHHDWMPLFLAATAQPAPLTISPLEEQQLFDSWCPYKGNPDPRVVWAAAVDAVNGVLIGVRAGGTT